jgi:WD40 repeat protein
MMCSSSSHSSIRVRARVCIFSLFLLVQTVQHGFAQAANLGKVHIAPAGHTQRITKLLRHPQSGELISCAADGAIHIWDSSAGALKRTIYLQDPARNQGGILAAALSPQGRLLAVSCTRGFQNSILLLDYASGNVISSLPEGYGLRALRTLTIFNTAANDIIFSADGRHIFAAFPDGRIKNWQIKEQGVTIEDALLAQGEAHFKIRVQKIETDAPIFLAIQRNRLRHLAYTGTTIFSLPDESNVRPNKLTNATKFFLHETPIVPWFRNVGLRTTGLSLLGDTMALVGDARGQLGVLSIKQPQSSLRTLALLPKGIRTTAISPNGQQYFIGGDMLCESTIVEVLTGKIISKLQINYHYSPLTHAVFLTDSTLATGDAEGLVFIWNAKTGAMFHACNGKGGTIHSLASNPNGQIAAGSCIGKNMLNPCAAQPILKPVPIHPIKWCFDPHTLTVSEDLQKYASFSAQSLVYNNTTILHALEQRGIQAGRSTDKKKISLPRDWDAFTYIPSFTHQGRILLPAADRLHYLQPNGEESKGFKLRCTLPAKVALDTENGYCILSGGRDRIVRVWSEASGKLILSLFVEDADNWVCWTPRLRYAYAGNAIAHVGSLKRAFTDLENRFVPLQMHPKAKLDPERIQKRLGRRSLATILKNS